MKLTATLFFLGAFVVNATKDKRKGIPASPPPIILPLPPRPPPPIILPQPRPFIVSPPAQVFPALTSCPPGYTSEGRQCRMEISTEPQLICNEGQLEGDTCFTSLPYGQLCPDEYTLNSGVCSKTETCPPMPICPAGYDHIDGCCLKRVPSAVIEVCGRGTRVGDMCQVVKSKPAKMLSYCPDGFEEEDGECCRIETYDCTAPGTELLDCNGDDDEGCKTRKWNLRYLTTKEPEYYMGSSSGGHKSERTKEVAVIHQTCQKKLARSMVHSSYCDEGELQGNKCVVVEQFPPIPRCAGKGGVRDCHHMEEAPFEFVCPGGFEMRGTKCVATETTPPIPTCPPGFKFEGGRCTSTCPPTLQCLKGTLGEDYMCHYTDFVSPRVTSPASCTETTCTSAVHHQSHQKYNSHHKKYL